jgi:hypothetical protein
VIPCKEISIASLLAETGVLSRILFIPHSDVAAPNTKIQGEKAADRVQSKNSAELVLVRCVIP